MRWRVELVIRARLLAHWYRLLRGERNGYGTVLLPSRTLRPRPDSESIHRRDWKEYGQDQDIVLRPPHVRAVVVAGCSAPDPFPCRVRYWQDPREGLPETRSKPFRGRPLHLAMRALDWHAEPESVDS